MLPSKSQSITKNPDFHAILNNGKKLHLTQRVDMFNCFISELTSHKQIFYKRIILSPADREVIVLDPLTDKPKPMLMFGSNNYLGLANHPYVKEKVKTAIHKYGAGIGGPPLLNGYTKMHHELEERLYYVEKNCPKLDHEYKD